MVYRWLCYWLGTIGFFNVSLVVGYSFNSLPNPEMVNPLAQVYLLPVWQVETGIMLLSVPVSLGIMFDMLK